MVHIQRTFTVEQPVEVVVDYLKDFGHAEQWDPGTVSCTRVGGGPIEVGTSWDNVSKVRGRETQLSYRLERLEDGRITFVGRNKTATSTDDITFTAVSDRHLSDPLRREHRLSRHRQAGRPVPAPRVRAAR